MQETNAIIMLNVDLIKPSPYQPRKEFKEETLNELAASIKEYGILNPILVRKKDDNYEIIAGERRFRAAIKAGLKEVPAIIKNIEENKISEIALIENLQRENISPIEEAESYEEILKNSNITEAKLSEMIGKSQSFISNKLRLLNLPNNIKDALLKRRISERHARTLLSVKDNIKQNELLNRIVNEKLTVKELENIINEKQITEAEIQNAINDIMKSLNISEEENQKEEKESDNMNNGNFFPNFNNNVTPDPNASLNSMNMQSMNNGMVLDGSIPNMNQEINPIPMSNNNQGGFTYQNPEVTPNLEVPTTPNVVMPQFDNVMSNPTMPSMDMNMTAPTGVEPIMPNNEIFINNQQPAFNNSALDSINNPLPPATPEFNQAGPELNNNMMNMDLNVPTMDNNSFGVQGQSEMMPSQNIETPQMIDPPIFNTTDNFNSQPMPNNDILMGQPNAFEVPVGTPNQEVMNSQVNNQEPMMMPNDTMNTQAPESNKLTMLEEFLNNNGISYKLYNNDNSNCLIIEMEK